ncbi:hypothetical protein B0T22DRAFT_275232 [Podospora appendiculata]|uniref:Cyclin-D1-binding protein 1-like N-terminal domain-containing protein n=1 Tax=Podospora appendiculata TaxID=314037 RepID=A0AAE0X021_9PEZI|nr:hypothetical protein B0T22DRAFT_275232 [Podospora appendiculata]
MSSSSDALETLNTVVSSTLTFITQLEAVIADIASKNRPDNDAQKQNGDGAATMTTADSSSSLEPLSLAHDSAILIKAHATKISLFIINNPFTPTAIVKVIRELVAGPLPGLASAVQLCTAERYTQTIQRDLAWRSGRVLREFKELLSRIPTDGKILSDEKKNASVGAAAGKGSLATTGVLWAACDDLVAFCNRGFAGNLVQKVEQFRDTLKDVMEELKEWGEETAEDNGDDDDDDDDDEVNQVAGSMASTQILSSHDQDQAMVDEFMNSEQFIPRDDPDRIRPRLESCLKRLRLVTLFYQATIKRRLKPLPHLPPSHDSTVPSRLDEIMSLLSNIPERFGGLALAFYELEPTEIDCLMDQCFFDVFAGSELLVKPWSGDKDEFTDWALKFQVEIKKG